MCEITKRLKRITSKEIVAWKCINHSSTATRWQPLTMGGWFYRGVWEQAQNPYTGFNCYLTRKDALKSGWSTSDHPVRVRIRKIEGYGEMYGVKIVFAREIFVPRGRSRKSK